VLGRKRVKTYIPVLNTMQILAILYERLGWTNKAKGMYSCALDGLKAVLGRSSKRFEDNLAALAALDSADDSLRSLMEDAL
jgi:hypothetical protein